MYLFEREGNNTFGEMNPGSAAEMNAFLSVAQRRRRREEREQRGAKTAEAKENSREGIEIFLSVKRWLTGRANDRCTERTNSVAQLASSHQEFLRVYTHKK